MTHVASPFRMDSLVKIRCVQWAIFYYEGVQIEMKMDRNRLSVVTLRESDDDAYWQSCTATDRLRAMQINRQVAYGKSNATGRLQRVLEVVKRPHS